MAQQQADALQLLAETALHHGIDPGAPASTTRWWSMSTPRSWRIPISPASPSSKTAPRFCRNVPAPGCDASRVVMKHDEDGRIFEVGAKTRTIPPALRRALLHRDRSCRFPGCHGRFCQAHHIRHWAQGGPTTLSNLVLLCRRHHRAVHEEGYQVDRQPDGELRFRRPDGRVIPNVPRPPEAPTDPVGTVRTRNDEAGIVVGPRTATPSWQGERLDLGYAIDVLHPLAR